MNSYEIHRGRRYDIVVGIPSYNEGKTIGFVAEQIDRGLTKHFPDKRALIINVDSNSQDNTKEAFLGVETKAEKLFHIVEHEVRGKGSNFFYLFELVRDEQPEAIMVVDADLRSITPDWVLHLLSPIYDGYDFATPYYARHKYDGTITNNICYPLTYGIFGVNLRQPIGGDFAFSLRMNNHWLEQQWSISTRQYGIDIFMTLHAITGGFKLCEVSLGSKIHNPSAPKLDEMFLQVCDTILRTITNNAERLRNETSLVVTPRFGSCSTDKVQDLTFDAEAIKEKTLLDLEKHWPLVEEFLSGEKEKLRSMLENNELVISVDTWISLLFSLIISYARSPKERRRDVLLLLRTAYFGRTYSFIQETRDMSTPEAEELIIAQAKRLRERRGELFTRLQFLLVKGRQEIEEEKNIL